MRVAEEHAHPIGLQRTNRQRGRAFERRVALAAKRAARPLNTRQRSNAFAQFTGSAGGDDLADTVAIAVLVTR